MTDSTSKPTTTAAAVDQVSEENHALITRFIASKRLRRSMIKVGREVHPDLSFELVIPMIQKFNHALLLTIPWSELENTSSLPTPLSRWIHQILPGELGKHALSEAAKAITKAGKAKHLREKLDHTGESSGIAALLQFPFFPFASIRVRNQIGISAVLEYLTAEVLEFTGHEARSVDCRCCFPSHLAKSLSEDVELKELVLEKLKCEAEMGLTSTGEPVPFPHYPNLLDCFPHTQKRIQSLLEKCAWFHKPEKVEEVLSKFASGELKPGDPKFHQMFVHPFAYLGLSGSGVFVGEDEHCFNPTTVDEDDYEMVNLCDAALLSVAFDIEDASGRWWPLVVEYRGEICIDAPLYSNYGGVFDRVTGKQVGSISFTDCGGELTLDSGVADGYFSEFASHGFEDGKEPFGENEKWNRFGETHPSKHSTYHADQDETTPHPSEPLNVDTQTMIDRREWEIAALICAALPLCHLKNLNAFSAYHPPKVVSRFTRVILRQAFDSAEVIGALTPNFHLPDVLVDLIGEYTPVELLYLPLFDATSDSTSDDGGGGGDDDEGGVKMDKLELSEISRLLEDAEQAKQEQLEEEEEMEGEPKEGAR